MKSPRSLMTIVAATAITCASGTVYAQITSSTVFPNAAREEGSALPDPSPTLTHRYGGENAYSRWRATGQWDPPFSGDSRNTPPPSSTKPATEMKEGEGSSRR